MKFDDLYLKFHLKLTLEKNSIGTEEGTKLSNITAHSNKPKQRAKYNI